MNELSSNQWLRRVPAAEPLSAIDGLNALTEVVTATSDFV